MKALGALEPYESGKGVRRGWALCCPFCEEGKMAPYKSRDGWWCISCGGRLAAEAAASYKGLYVVEE